MASALLPLSGDFSPSEDSIHRLRAASQPGGELGRLWRVRDSHGEQGKSSRSQSAFCAGRQKPEGPVGEGDPAEASSYRLVFPVLALLKMYSKIQTQPSFRPPTPSCAGAQMPSRHKKRLPSKRSALARLRKLQKLPVTAQEPWEVIAERNQLHWFFEVPRNQQVPLVFWPMFV